MKDMMYLGFGYISDMKGVRPVSAFSLLLCLVFSSCTFEKRLYRNGFYFDRTHSNNCSVRDSLRVAPPPTACVIPDVEMLEPYAASNESHSPDYSRESDCYPNDTLAPDKKAVAKLDKEQEEKKEKSYSPNDDLWCGLIAVGIALLQVVVVGITMGFVPIAGIIVSVLLFVLVMWIIIRSVESHTKRNQKRKERGEAMTHLEFGRRLFVFLLWLGAMLVSLYTLFLSVMFFALSR